MPLEKSQVEQLKARIESTNLKLREQVQEWTTEMKESEAIAKQFHEEGNKETFFHDGQVSRAVRIKANFVIKFDEELKEKEEE